MGKKSYYQLSGSLEARAGFCDSRASTTLRLPFGSGGITLHTVGIDPAGLRAERREGAVSGTAPAGMQRPGTTHPADAGSTRKRFANTEL